MDVTRSYGVEVKPKIITRQNMGEIASNCISCGSRKSIAFWDLEKKCYIFFNELPLICPTCKTHKSFPDYCAS